MTPREIIERTITYSNPERVGRSFHPSDIVWTGHTVQTRATDWVKTGESKWERTDEWGNTWSRIDPTSKGEVTRGVLESTDQIENYQFPDFSRKEDYRRAREDREKHPDHYLLGSLPGFTFNIARKLFKLENYLMYLLTDLDKLHLLHDRIDEMLVHMIRNYARAGLDAIMFPEDWGTQDALLINPALWEQEFFPRFKHLCGVARDAGIKVWMHSCGKISAIVEKLMEAGVSVLQFDQPELHELQTLAAYQEKGNITFWCPVDIQKTLQTKDEELIRTRAREMLETLWRGRGGFIAGFYSDNASIGLDPRWQEIACESFLKNGVRESAAV